MIRPKSVFVIYYIGNIILYFTVFYYLPDLVCSIFSACQHFNTILTPTTPYTDLVYHHLSHHHTSGCFCHQNTFSGLNRDFYEFLLYPNHLILLYPHLLNSELMFLKLPCTIFPSSIIHTDKNNFTRISIETLDILFFLNLLYCCISVFIPLKFYYNHLFINFAPKDEYPVCTS